MHLKRSRLRVAVFVLGALFLLLVADTVYEAWKTLNYLDVIEAERDSWQRPGDVVAALSLKPGDTVVDFGCGSGYFALKLAAAVGPTGRVKAVDVRRPSLFFLWLRSLRKDMPQIQTLHSKPDDPGQAANSADAVLIANTYHELGKPEVILDHLFRALRSGGRLVLIDPLQTEHGEVKLSTIEDTLRGRGFDIVTRDDSFLDQPGRGTWGMIVVRKP